ncbi:MAG: DUF2973 domain-containing protein [Cyanobacteria bacterium J06642_3]
MFHLVYILVFTVIAFLAISNLVRNLINLSKDTARRNYSYSNRSISKVRSKANNSLHPNLHPELLDESGRIINEPLLLMRSASVDDVRRQLDEIYDASPSRKSDATD